MDNVCKCDSRHSAFSGVNGRCVVKHEWVGLRVDVHGMWMHGDEHEFR